jgi:F-type H+-transporting ATPase subunit a
MDSNEPRKTTPEESPVEVFPAETSDPSPELPPADAVPPAEAPDAGTPIPSAPNPSEVTDTSRVMVVDQPGTAAPIPPAAPASPAQPNWIETQAKRFQAWVQANPRRAAIWGGVILLLLLSFVIRAPQPHVALSGEPLLPGGWFTNTLLTTIIVDIIVLALAFFAGSNMKLVPSGLQNVMEAIVEYLYGLAESVAGSRAPVFFPWAATIFLFVLVSNYTGLIPGVGSIGYYHEEEHASRSLEGQLAMANGKLLLQESEGSVGEEGESHEGAATEEHAAEAEAHGPKFVPLFRAPSADLNVTFALALATMVMVQVHGVRALGGSYFRKFWNTSGQGFMKGINIFVGILEAISELSRILSFAFRLFGNIFAGEVVLATMAFLITFLVPIPFYALEVLVGAVQALVFAMLSLVFFTMATISHGHDDHGEHAEAHH